MFVCLASEVLFYNNSSNRLHHIRGEYYYNFFLGHCGTTYFGNHCWIKLIIIKIIKFSFLIFIDQMDIRLVFYNQKT